MPAGDQAVGDVGVRLRAVGISRAGPRLPEHLYADDLRWLSKCAQTRLRRLRQRTSIGFGANFKHQSRIFMSGVGKSPFGEMLGVEALIGWVLERQDLKAGLYRSAPGKEEQKA